MVRHNTDKGADEARALAGHEAGAWRDAGKTSKGAVEDVEQMELVVAEVGESHPNEATLPEQ